MQKTEHKTYLHLWAVVPPPGPEQQIDQIRKEFSEQYGAVAALKPPVHLTLYKPFSVPVAEVKKHLEKLRRLIATHPCFSLELKNFGFFEHQSPVAFIDVAESPELSTLNDLLCAETIRLFGLQDKGRQLFHPHFTIGYRDIPGQRFPEIKRSYSARTFSAAFEVKQICLFRHNGKIWELQHELPLAISDVAQGALWT